MKNAMQLKAIIKNIGKEKNIPAQVVLQNYPLNENTIKIAFKEILSLDVSDEITFRLIKIDTIRKDDQYGGFRVSIEAVFDTLIVPLKLEIPKIDYSVYADAIAATSEKRESTGEINKRNAVLENIKKSSTMNKCWSEYQEEFTYAKDLTFAEVIKEVENLIELI